jgi:hypothetical protein
MPYFRVMIEGEGIDVPSENNGPSIIGFFTTRIVEASTAEAAESKAKNMILAEWSTGTYAETNRSSLPTMVVESVIETGFLESVKFKNEGYTFYTKADEAQTNNDA